MKKKVALFTRAWIEIKTDMLKRIIVRVALFTRAWIEISNAKTDCSTGKGRPLHEGVD